MEWIRPDINLDFVGMRFKAFLFSLILIVLGMAVLAYRGGLNLGVDFAGGTLIQVKFKDKATPDQIRTAMANVGVAQSAVQQVGASSDNEFLIRTEVSTSEVENFSQKISEDLTKAFGEGNVTIRRVETVGPKVGGDLRQKALFAIYYALLFISIYISGRFEMKWGSSAIMAAVLLVGVYLLEAVGMPAVYLIFGALVVTLALSWVLKLPYALAAVVALVHDVLITVGAFALTNREFSLEVLAALLTLTGYSLNDTIVVFDRIRENIPKTRREGLAHVINSSINQTLSRTILTSGATLLSVVCLFVFGGAVIHDFSFALLVGIVTGTYSSIFVASPLLILYEDWTRKKPAAKKA